MDAGHTETEAILKALEKRITKEYQIAAIEIQEKMDDYLKRFETKDKIWQKWVKDGVKTKKQYNDWRIGQMAMGKRWAEQKEAIAEELTNVTELAKAVVYDTMPIVYAANHNYGTYDIEHSSKLDTSYTLMDRNTAATILSDKKLYHDPGAETERRIAEGLEMRWNKQQIQSVMLQGILQGESIPKLSQRLATTVSSKDKNASIRNARTMTTGVQNAGRVDSYKRAQNMGINTRQQWIATLDGRTRHSHRVLDGQIVDVGEKFSNGCRFPGDPQGPAWEVYNCRCTLIASLKGFETDHTKLRNDAKLGEMSYSEWKKGKGESQKITKPEKTAEALMKQYVDDYKNLQATPFESNQLKKVLGAEYAGFQKLVDNSSTKAAYSKYADACTIKRVNKRGCYRTALDTVEFDYTNKEGLNKYTTLSHECGHMFDEHIGKGNLHFSEATAINEACNFGSGAFKIIREVASQSDEFLTALRKDMDAIKPNLKEVAKELLSTAEMRNATNGIQDALGGFFATQGQGLLPWGHGNRYYNNVYSSRIKGIGQEKNFKQVLNDLGFDASSQAKSKMIARQYTAAVEAFANMNAALTVGGKQLEMVEKYMPNTIKAYRQIIEGV